MLQYLSHVWQDAIKWLTMWRQKAQGLAPAIETIKANPDPESNPPDPLQLAPQPASSPVPINIIAPKAKWARPKGLNLLSHKPRPIDSPTGPRKLRAPRPTMKAEDQERWGQYYFRDQILDQLDQYFIYLKRLKKRAGDIYEFHRQLGIHVVPAGTIQNLDSQRFDGTLDELDAWWKENRPSFGAIAYGIDRDSIDEDKISSVDAPPEWGGWNSTASRKAGKLPPTHRINTITGGDNIKDEDGTTYKTGVIWTPKFLIFSKFDGKRIPPTIQRVVDGDVYSLTIYWDRIEGRSRKWLKGEGKKGGVPQEYAVCVERSTGKVRLLKTLFHDAVKIRHKHGHDRGKEFSIPCKHWGIPIEHLDFAVGRTNVSPEDHLRRIFIEAALMYQNASLGSMIRVEAHKGELTAAFGVDIKRTSYFFRDRDVTVKSLTSGGRRRPVFHIVRPHERRTKRGTTIIPMHFSGLKQFEWAGYKIIITVPGRDHFHLSDFDIGAGDKKSFKRSERLIDMKGLGHKLRNQMDKGDGKWN